MNLIATHLPFQMASIQMNLTKKLLYNISAEALGLSISVFGPTLCRFLLTEHAGAIRKRCQSDLGAYPDRSG